MEGWRLGRYVGMKTLETPLAELDPFGTAGSLGADERQLAGNQSVCSLQAFLQLAAHTDKLVIFDLYRPPRRKRVPAGLSFVFSHSL
ncbi:unnamed protein product [Pleuronectes platessa]|uniref:Uncharacterized protein n=1 Tax=Pleuronectes platessa TaxID=8262 RepID=A0A9N7V9R5_PLEPL|nr:unnamed protein product [Pleuronectes platessa]